MKAVAAVFADFEETFLGRPATLLHELAGKPILRRTLERLVVVEGLAQRCLLVSARDADRAHALLTEWQLDAQIELLPSDPGRRPRRSLIRSARKWNLTGWRGSPLGMTWFDEFCEPLCAAIVLDHSQADAVLCLDAYMPLLDPRIATQMLARAAELEAEAKFLFTQAPPGLAGVLLRRGMVRELLESDTPLGLALAYRPEGPQGDPINRPPCLPLDPDILHTAARFTGDTQRSREVLEAGLAALGEAADARAWCRWHTALADDRPPAGVAPNGRCTKPLQPPLPDEIELELTTEDPLPGSLLRPRGPRVPPRQLTDIAALNRWLSEFAAYDDRLLVLGGHGDPLLHPDFPQVCQAARAAGICGLAVKTPLVELPEPALEALFVARVDLIQVLLDADSPGTYATVHGRDAFQTVISNIERVLNLRKERLSPQPIVVPTITRAAPTLHEIEPFYDRWIRVAGWAVIEGYAEFGGKLGPDSLLSAVPSFREPCRRLSRRLMLLADGTVSTCDQDVAGRQPLGEWRSTAIRECWQGNAHQVLCAAQARLDFAALPVCQACKEWSRA